RTRRGRNRSLDQLAVPVAGKLVAQAHEGQLVAVLAAVRRFGITRWIDARGRRTLARDLVKRRYVGAGADVAGVDPVVVEISARQLAFDIADQAIFGDLRGIELHLDLHVPGNGQQRLHHFLAEHAAAFLQAVDVVVAAVAGIG